MTTTPRANARKEEEGARTRPSAPRKARPLRAREARDAHGPRVRPQSARPSSRGAEGRKEGS